MKKINLIFNYKDKKLRLKVNKVPWWYEGVGLMFSKEKNAEALLFSFRKSTRMAIFSLFIPFEFLAIWLDDKNKIIDKKVVKKGEMNVKPKVKFTKLIEIPINDKYSKILKLLDED